LELLVEGTLIRVYHYQDKWIYSTKRCINSKRSKWLSSTSFHEMFEEALAKECGDIPIWDRLEKRNCYSFVMCHPKNNIVVNYDDMKLYHIGTRNMDTLLEIEVDIGIDKVPYKRVESTTLECLKELETTNELTTEGYMLIDSNYRRQKFSSKIFKRAREVWGNTNDRFFRYLEIRHAGPKIMQEYLTYFPQDREKFAEYELKVIELSQHILHHYLAKHVSKKSAELPFYLKKLIYDLHGEFLRTREMTDIVKIMSWLEKLDVKLVYYFYQNSKKENTPTTTASEESKEVESEQI